MNDSFLNYIKEQFSSFGTVHIRKMFGGAGMYLDGVFFGIIDDDTVYLKADETTKQDYIDEGMPAFVYEGKNKPITLSYYQLPEDVLEDTELLRIWVEKSIQIA